jgi:hypothetical protein
MANYYFDANALLKYSILQNYKTEQGVNEIKNLVLQTDNQIFYSSLTLLESWNVIFKDYRKGIFGNRRKRSTLVLQTIIAKLQYDIQHPPFIKIDSLMDENTVIKANKLIEHYGITYNVGSLDMLHIALVKQSTINNLIMVSSDRGVKTICQKETITIFDPQSIEI